MMSGPFSVWEVQFPDKTWKVGLRLGEYEAEINTGMGKPEWTFKAISDAYHFGESEGRKRTLKKIESERQFNKDRSVKERFFGVVCLLIGHNTWSGMDSYCTRCGTMFGILKEKPKENKI